MRVFTVSARRFQRAASRNPGPSHSGKEAVLLTQGVVVDGQRHTGLSVEYMKAVVPGGYDGAGPQEAVMNRGDVLIWHHW